MEQQTESSDRTRVRVSFDDAGSDWLWRVAVCTFDSGLDNESHRVPRSCSWRPILPGCPRFLPLPIAQQNLGHASLATTAVYVTAEKRRRMKAVEAFWKR